MEFLLIGASSLVYWFMHRNDTPTHPKLFWTLLFGWFYLLYYILCCNRNKEIGGNYSAFAELCKVSTVITVTSWIGGAHATSDNGKRISVPQGFPSLISIAANYGLYPTTCDVAGGMLTLVKKEQ